MTRSTLSALLFLCLSSTAGAQTSGEAPDLKLTPGECRPMSLQQVCGTKWGKDARAVTQAMKEHVFAAYGIPKSARHLPNGRAAYEIDHLCSRELAGADTEANLWPQKYTGPWNAHLKDRVENKLHVEACAGRITLQQAQHMVVSGWRQAFVRYYGEPK